MASYSVNLFSVSELKNLSDDLKQYEKDLENKCREVARQLALKGAVIARMQIVDLDAVFTSELLGSISVEDMGGSVFAVVAGTDHAMFVEFGTGIIGKKSSYKGNLPTGVQWNYASGKTIRKLMDGRYGWFYPADDGNWYFTEGMPSRPFMYNMSIELYNEAVGIVKEVFKR